MVKKSIDWDLVEADWRAGVKTKQQMSVEHGVSRAAIDKHFAKLGIERDLTGKIRAKAESLVAQDAVTSEVTPATASKEREIVEANAEMQAGIIRAHRKDIQKSRNLVSRLVDELSLQTDGIELLQELGELLRKEDDKGVDKLNDLYQKVVALPGRVDSIKKLSDALKTLVGLERQAFGLADTAEGDKPPPEKKELSETELARRVAFLLTSASNKKD